MSHKFPKTLRGQSKATGEKDIPGFCSWSLCSCRAAPWQRLRMPWGADGRDGPFPFLPQPLPPPADKGSCAEAGAAIAQALASPPPPPSSAVLGAKRRSWRNAACRHCGVTARWHFPPGVSLLARPVPVPGSVSLSHTSGRQGGAGQSPDRAPWAHVSTGSRGECRGLAHTPALPSPPAAALGEGEGRSQHPGPTAWSRTESPDPGGSFLDAPRHSRDMRGAAVPTGCRVSTPQPCTTPWPGEDPAVAVMHPSKSTQESHSAGRGGRAEVGAVPPGSQQGREVLAPAVLGTAQRSGISQEWGCWQEAARKGRD